MIPFRRTAYRSATRSSQPGRRSRPVTVPYSWPSSRTRPASGLHLARERPGADARHVRLRDADHLVDPRRPDPDPRRRGAGHRVRRGDERIRAVVEVEERALGALEQARACRRGAPGARAGTCPPRTGAAASRSPRTSTPRPRGRRARARRPAAARRSSPRARPRSSGAGSSRRAGPGRGSRASPPCRRRPGPIPRRVVPIWSLPSRFSLPPSIAMCHGMIRCAFPEIRSGSTLRPALLEVVDLGEQHLRVDDAAVAEDAHLARDQSRTGSGGT